MEKIDTLRRKIIKSGLATLVAGGLVGASAVSGPKKAMAGCQSCETCQSCPGKCATCSSCQTCSNGGSNPQH